MESILRHFLTYFLRRFSWIRPQVSNMLKKSCTCLLHRTCASTHLSMPRVASDWSHWNGFVTAGHFRQCVLPLSVLVAGNRQCVEKSFVIVRLSWLTTEWPGTHDAVSVCVINSLPWLTCVISTVTGNECHAFTLGTTPVAFTLTKRQVTSAHGIENDFDIHLCLSFWQTLYHRNLKECTYKSLLVLFS